MIAVFHKTGISDETIVIGLVIILVQRCPVFKARRQNPAPIRTHQPARTDELLQPASPGPFAGCCKQSAGNIYLLHTLEKTEESRLAFSVSIVIAIVHHHDAAQGLSFTFSNKIFSHRMLEKRMAPEQAFPLRSQWRHPLRRIPIHMKGEIEETFGITRTGKIDLFYFHEGLQSVSCSSLLDATSIQQSYPAHVRVPNIKNIMSFCPLRAQ